MKNSILNSISLKQLFTHLYNNTLSKCGFIIGLSFFYWNRKESLAKIQKNEDYPEFCLDLDYPNNLNLVQVLVFFRHGDRSPIWLPKDDPHQWFCHDEKDPTKTVPCFAGQLSAIGEQQLSQLGSKLRELYIDRLQLLSYNYKFEELLAQSTNVSRTKQSLINLLNSLYPLSTRNNLESIPFYVRDHTEEILYPNILDCQRLEELFRIYHQTEQHNSKNNLKIILKDWLQKENEAGNKPSLSDIFEYTYCLFQNGKPLPEGISQNTFDELSVMTSDHWWGAFQKSRSISRLGAGRIFQEIISQMDQKKKKIILYSGHDSTIGPLLGALQVFNNQWPHYASFCLLEVFEDKKNHKERFIRFIYNDKPLVLPCAIEEKNPTFCPEAKFRQFIEPIIPKDYRSECDSIEDGKQKRL